MKLIIKALVIIFLIVGFGAITQQVRAAEHWMPNEFTANKEEAWGNFLLAIKNDKDNHIVIYANGLGGRVDLLYVYMKTITYIKYTHLGIIDEIMTGNSYSAHAIAACQADTLEFNGHWLMFHMVEGIPLLSKEYKIFNTDGDKMYFKALSRECMTKGILTNQDIDKMFQGFEVWVTKQNGKFVKHYIPDRRLKDTKPMVPFKK